MQQIKKLKARLKAEYFEQKAKEINFARERKSVEKEFRLSKSFDYCARFQKSYVTAKVFAAFFEQHFWSDPQLEEPLPYEIRNYDNLEYMHDVRVDIF